MKQYVIDELRLGESGKVRIYLEEHYSGSEMGGLFWIPVDETILTGIQAEHAKCKPFYFAIEVEEDRLACELLVRTKNKIRCDCIAYADENQRNWIIRFVDEIFENLGITT